MLRGNVPLYAAICAGSSKGMLMGIIQQQQRKAANQRVAAPRMLEVKCANAGLADAVRELFATWNSAADAAFEASLAAKDRLARWASSGSSPNSRHYFILERPDHLMVTFGARAQFVADRNLTGYGQGWVARIEPTGTGKDDARRIEVTLLKWSVDDGGRIWNGYSYVQMLDGLVAGLDGRCISEPVDHEDCLFVSLA